MVNYRIKIRTNNIDRIINNSIKSANAKLKRNIESIINKTLKPEIGELTDSLRQMNRQVNSIIYYLDNKPIQRSSREKYKEIADKIIEEIHKYKNGELDRFTQNKEFAEEYGVSISLVSYYIIRLIVEVDRRYRMKQIRREYMKRLHSDPIFEEASRKRCRKGMNKLHADPEFKKANREQMMKLHADPEFKKACVERGRKSMEKLHSDPEFKEALRERAKKLVEENKIYEYNGIEYHSMSEAAIANLLEKYVSGYKIIKGKTWQVNSTISKTIDFLINNEFMEFHEILRFYGNNRRGDFRTFKEYQIYKELIEKSKDKNKFDNLVTCLLAARYMTERLKAIKESKYKNPLILCVNTEDVYDKVISKYSQVSKEEFKSDYNQLKKEIKNQQIPKAA